MSIGSEITNLVIEDTSANFILISWDVLGPVLAYGNLITFSIYLRTPNLDLITTTKDLQIELALPLLSSVNYTIQVELQVPFTTHTISTTSYYFLAPTTEPSTTTTSTTNVMDNLVLQNTNLLTQYSYGTMVGIIILIFLIVLVFMIQSIGWCILKRRATKGVEGISTLADTEDKKQENVTFGENVITFEIN